MSSSAFNPALVIGGSGQRYYVDIKQDHGAKGDGVTDDSAAFVSFNTWGRAQTVGVTLVMPPGAYHVVGSPPQRFTLGVKDLVVEAYGASIDKIFLGGGFYQDNLHDALVNTVTAGSTTATCITLADAAKFIVGNWVCLTAFDMQGGASYPPNPLLFEYRQVSAINLGTGVITFDRLVLNSYLSTLPNYGDGDSNSTPSPGPARLFMMNPDWDQRVIIKGLNVTQATDIFGACRSLHYIDCTFTASPDVSVGTDVTLTNCRTPYTTPTLMEIDKCINNLVLDNFSHRTVKLQSSSIEKFEMRNSRITQLQGTAKHNIFDNCDFESIGLGNVGFGTTYSLSIRNCRTQDFHISQVSHSVLATSIVNGRVTLSKNQYAGFGTSAIDNNWVYNSVYFLNECLPFRITNVTDNGIPNVTVTDGIFNSDNTVSTAGSAPFLVTDVGLFLKNTSGIPSNTKVASFIDANHITIDHSTTATGTGKTVTINRALLFFDTTLPATINLNTGVSPAPAGNWTIRPHPCLDVNVHGCVGIDIPRNLKNLNRAPHAMPYGSYALYRLIGGTYASVSGSDIWGYITKLRINVRRAYTGTRPTLFVGLGSTGIGGFATENSANPIVFYNPCVDVKTVGERIMIPGTTTGTAGADTLLNFTTQWIKGSFPAPILKTTTTGGNVVLTSENQTVWPIIEIELFTDQGPVVSAAI